MDEHATSTGAIAEEAYLFDLYVATRWQEVFNELLDEKVKPVDRGSILHAECGTGNYALGLAASLPKVNVVGVDARDALLAIAKAKAQVKKLKNITFQAGNPSNVPFATGEFDLVVGDLSMRPVAEIEDALVELQRVAGPGTTVAVVLATHGSFDELYSIYWETLFELELLEYYPGLEKLIAERPTLSEMESIAERTGLRDVHSEARKQIFEFEDAATFLGDPIFARYFLPGWLDIVSESERARISEALHRIIDRERQEIPLRCFDQGDADRGPCAFKGIASVAEW